MLSPSAAGQGGRRSWRGAEAGDKDGGGSRGRPGALTASSNWLPERAGRETSLPRHGFKPQQSRWRFNLTKNFLPIRTVRQDQGWPGQGAPPSWWAPAEAGLALARVGEEQRPASVQGPGPNAPAALGCSWCPMHWPGPRLTRGSDPPAGCRSWEPRGAAPLAISTVQHVGSCTVTLGPSQGPGLGPDQLFFLCWESAQACRRAGGLAGSCRVTSRPEAGSAPSQPAQTNPVSHLGST